MENYNPYIRLQRYYSYLINDHDATHIDDTYKLGIPLHRLSDITNIPITVIRKDFLCIFQWQNSMSLASHSDQHCILPKWNTILSFDEDTEEYKQVDYQYNLGKLYEKIMDAVFPDEFEKLLLEGVLDNIPIFMDTNTFSPTYKLTLTQNEASALHLLEKNDSKTRKELKKIDATYISLYDIKDSYMFNHQYSELNDKLDLINIAINENLYLDAKYKTGKGELISFSFHPLKIVYDVDENLYSVLSVCDGTVLVNRLDHFVSLRHSEKKPALTLPVEDFLDFYPNVWGNCFSDTPEKVKIKFYNEANVWKKVKKDLANRTNGKLYEKDGFLYYEDIVYGISKFRSWIYGYGSSAIVLEPQSLREYIIASLKERLSSDY